MALPGAPRRGYGDPFHVFFGFTVDRVIRILNGAQDSGHRPGQGISRPPRAGTAQQGSQQRAQHSTKNGGDAGRGGLGVGRRAGHWVLVTPDF